MPPWLALRTAPLRSDGVQTRAILHSLLRITMFTTLLLDLRHKAEWYDLRPTPGSLLRMCGSDGSTAQILYRVMRFCQTHHLKPLAFLLYRLNAMLGHVVIGRGADFGPGLVILHSFGIVINSRVKAGRNLVLEHGVTIGAEKNQSPTLGDNVFIGAGAKIIGPVRIGSDVKIGANAVVIRDVPDGATVVGIPARVVKIYGERVAPTREPEQDLASV
jgi:serine O-acetyltransferase